MTLVKICGITNIDDAYAAAEAGADYLGFIAVPQTPRYIPPDVYIDMVASLPQTVLPVVVVRDVADGEPYTPQYLQYYEGRVTDAMPASRLIRVLSPRTEADLKALNPQNHRLSAVMIHSYHPEKLGGAGVTGDWDLARQAVEKARLFVFLAGGLTPENVADAVRLVRPFAVDVSSGVEESPGRKDQGRIRAFIEAVREADRS